jgi:transcriptional regulator with XRE-family HTH domain
MEERKRLGRTQDEFAAVAGVTRNPYGVWEKGATAPDAKQLSALAGIGADVQYIVTGIRSDVALAPDERELLALYRAAPLTGKAAAVGALQGVLSGASQSGGLRDIKIKGGAGHQVAGGKIINKGGGGK